MITIRPINDDILLSYLQEGAETTEDIILKHTGIAKVDGAFTYLPVDDYILLRREMNRIRRMLIRLQKHQWVERIPGEGPRRWRAI